MSDDEITLLAIKGFIAELPEDDRAQVGQCISQVRAILAIHNKHIAALTIALLGAELQLGIGE